MLSILRRQSETLEKELLECRQQLEQTKRTQSEHATVVASKDAQIAELERELSRRRPLDEVILCRACGSSTDEEEDPQPETPMAVDTVLLRLEELKKALRATESRLSQSELEKAMAELQLITHTSRLRRDLTRELDGVRAAAREAASKAAKSLEVAKATERKITDELATKDVVVAEMQAGMKRRDEQIEFLMQVHDASQGCEWVSASSGSRSVCGATPSASSVAYAGNQHVGSLGTDAERLGASWRSAEVAAALANTRQTAGGSCGSGLNSPAAHAVFARELWQCRRCTLRNSGMRTLCEACGLWRRQVEN